VSGLIGINAISFVMLKRQQLEISEENNITDSGVDYNINKCQGDREIED